MKKTWSKLVSLTIALALIILVFPIPVSGAEGDVTITIYHTNDVHGYVEQVVNKDGGIKHLGLGRVAALYAATQNALLVDAGDFSQGNVFANLAHGSSTIEAMNAAGYDLAALGNHEFDYSIKELDDNIASADFTILSANVTIAKDKAAEYPNLSSMPLYTVKEAGGKKIAFFALNTPELSGMANPSKLKDAGISVRTDLAPMAEEIVKTIQQNETGIDAIVALTHSGYTDKSGVEGSHTVAAVKGVDVVIDGHDHQVRLGDTAKNINGTLVVSSGSGLTALGMLELTFTAKGELKITSSNAFDTAKELDTHPETEQTITKWNDEFAIVKETIVFNTEINLWGGNVDGLSANNEEIKASITRRGETNAGTLMADVRQWKAQQWLDENYNDPAFSQFNLNKDMPVVSMQGGGGVRGSALAGKVTLEQLMNVFAFGFENAEDTYILATPKILYDTLEHGVNIFSGQDTSTGMLEADGSIHGRFPLPGGFSYVYDITQPASEEFDKENNTMPAVIGTRVLSITLDNGTELNREDTETPILIVTSAYVIKGGDGYWMQGALNNAENFGGYVNVPEIATPTGNYGDFIIEYVNTVHNGTLPAEAYPIRGNRITRVNDPYTPKTFDAHITFTKDGTALLDETDFTLYTNGLASDISCNKDGTLALSLENGPNELRFISKTGDYDSGSIYLDNYAGLHNALVTNSPGELSPEKEKAPVSSSMPDSEPEESIAPETKQPANNTLLWVAIPIGAIALAGIGFAVVKSKKKNDTNSTKK